MVLYSSELVIEKLEPRKGGYFYLPIEAATVSQFPQKRATRLICTLDAIVSYPCGLSHLGDGNFFIILAQKHLKTLQKHTGDLVRCALHEDPNPLGVEMPDVLDALLTQDDELKAKYDQFTDGKKRSLIHSMNTTKDIDRQVRIAIAMLNGLPRINALKL